MTEDIRENEMSGGVPARIRALDSEGNSITPTIKEVASSLPKINQEIISLENEEEYHLVGYEYNTLFVYEISSSGEGCMALLGWYGATIFGSSIFTNIDTSGKICIFRKSLGIFAIKNNIGDTRRISINVV